jgi:ketosteroid isomerase-like protein
MRHDRRVRRECDRRTAQNGRVGRAAHRFCARSHALRSAAQCPRIADGRYERHGTSFDDASTLGDRHRSGAIVVSKAGPCLVVSSLLAVAACAHAAEDDRALVARQSQEFSDASAAGDGKTLARYVDDRVIFMNETGEIATKADLAQSTPPPAGMVNKLVQTDVRIELHGDTAVTSFTDNLTQHANGAERTASFLSTEVWQKENGRWLMISSQTMTRPSEPVATALPAAQLDDYVGTYSANGVSVKIERKGAALASATNGAAATKLEMEARDVAFTPGQPRLRRVFIRDAGKIAGFLSIRESGDVFFKRT